MLKNHFTLNANTQYKSSCNHHNETGGRFLGSKHFRLRGILRCSIPLSVVAKVTYDKRQLASQAFRQILKHLPSSELEEVLHYLSVACRRLPFIVLTLARYWRATPFILYEAIFLIVLRLKDNPIKCKFYSPLFPFIPSHYKASQTKNRPQGIASSRSVTISFRLKLFARYGINRGVL